MRSLPRLLALCLAAASATAQTTTLWVDAARGNDTNPGTRARPFKSITKGVATGQQDAIIRVLPGVYSPSKTGEKFTIQLTAVYKNVRLLGAGAEVTILDFEKVVGSRNDWYFYIDAGATNIEIAGLTMRNGEFRPKVRWFSAAVWWSSVVGLEIHHCRIEGCESGFYSANGAQDVSIHDNVFLGNNVPLRFRQDQTKGAKNCRFYNNLVANSTGGYRDTVSPSTADPTQVFANNVVINNPGDGFAGGYPQGMVVESNLSWNNGGSNYNLGRAVPKSNLSVDPQIVDLTKDDFRLKTTSPCIEAGYAVPQPGMVNDYYGGARVSDWNDDRRALPDIGVHEAGGITLSVANWGQGKSARFSVAADQPRVGAAFVFVSVRPADLVADPIGSIGLDLRTLLLFGQTAIPGSVSLPVPVNPWFDNQTLHFQAFSLGAAWKPSGRLDLTL